MKKGFTLIELLAVVLIMGVLATIAMPQYTRSLNRARIAEAEQMLPAIYEARERAKIENQANGVSGRITAEMLDIGIKNATSVSGAKIETPNYTYYINKAKVVQATLKKGKKVKGVTFSYDGKDIYCCGPIGVCETVFNMKGAVCF